jgi:hypothetical protein
MKKINPLKKIRPVNKVNKFISAAKYSIIIIAENKKIGMMPFGIFVLFFINIP